MGSFTDTIALTLGVELRLESILRDLILLPDLLSSTDMLVSQTTTLPAWIQRLQDEYARLLAQKEGLHVQLPYSATRKPGAFRLIRTTKPDIEQIKATIAHIDHVALEIKQVEERLEWLRLSSSEALFAARVQRIPDMIVPLKKCVQNLDIEGKVTISSVSVFKLTST